ncbi:fatty-acid amide hydrolase 1 [Biomphalaria glabrata]|nr:fatty-acid amide hydrolase 1 [Biomphalaria glabrata]
MLKTLGAVPFCRTNVSQAQMSLSCNNPVYGETRNPIQRHRTCGGSSGGEGALIGGGGSVLGVGCDLGGSIRVPSHFCGTVGVKGTPKRISGAGSCPLGQEIVTVSEVYGPLGRDVDAVLAFYSSMLSPSVCTMDPLIPPLPWRHELYTKTSPMRIGFYTHDGCVLPVPAVVRAVHRAKSVLTQLGHTVVEFNPPDVLKALEKLLLPIVCGDKCQTLKENLSNDLVDPDLKETISLYSSPLWLRKLYSKLSNPLHPVSKACLNTKLPGSVANWWKLNEELEAYSRKFVKEWQSLGLDGVICPPFPYTAWPLDNGEKGLLGLMYTGLYNVLGYPCGVLPATVVTADDVISMKQYPNSNDGDKYIQQITVGSEGLPIGVQCVALPYQEETLLRIMKQLETGLREHKI